MARGLGLVIGGLPKVCNWVMGVTGISEKIRIGYEPPSQYQSSTKKEVVRFKLKDYYGQHRSW